MKRLLPLLAVGTLFLLVACAAEQAPPPQWTYERDAIQMRIKADPKLNLYDSEAHTLLLCTYQLSDPNTFNQLSGDQDGIYKLLECGIFGEGAVSSKRMFLQPDQTITLSLDRAEGARWVAVVAGYASLEKERMTKMMEIPEVVETKGFFKKKQTRKPAKLDVDLVLGPEQIIRMSAATPEKGE